MSESNPTSHPTAPTLPKTYQPAANEPGIRARWDASGAFHPNPQRVLSGEAKPFCILIPPPNVTGALHLGHALNNTLQDILTRSHRMKGFETLWMPGTDHAGIATQAVVERRLRKEGTLKGALKEAMTRDEFVAQVQVWKDEYEARITGQLKAMGCSCDFARQRFTMDDICARAVREAFFRLFKDGLIYRGKRLVNWDPVLQTAVADDECYDEELDSFFYYLRYPLVHQKVKDAAGQVQPVTWNELVTRGYPGASEHPGEQQAWVTVATTRPETYLGDTAVAINPKDPRAKALRGLMAELPLIRRVIPIVEDDYVVLPAHLQEDPEAAKSDPKAVFATGFLKVTPAHDPNDYEIGQRHSLAMINVMAPDATISDKHGWSNPDEVRGAHMLVGTPREEARKLVIAEFKARSIGDSGYHLFEGAKPYRHSVKHSDRSKAIVEPYLSDQWFVKVTDDRLAGSANRALVVEQRSATSGGTGVPPAMDGGTGVPPVQGRRDPYRRLEPVTGYFTAFKRNLPHFQVGGSTYFITFRTHQGDMNPKEREIALNAVRYWHGKKMELHGAVVMPDQLHMVMTPFRVGDDTWVSVSELLHSIKSFSAHAIASLRGQPGAVWQDESYDRIIRDQDEFAEKLRYMQLNPVTAGLANNWAQYPYTHVSEAAQAGRLEYSDRTRPVSATSSQDGTAMQGEDEHRRDACATGNETDGQLRFYPPRYAKMYAQWHDNIRDWCISRQLWWGHRIPVWSVSYRGGALTNTADVQSHLNQLLKELGPTQIERDLVIRPIETDGSWSEFFVCARTAQAAQRLHALYEFDHLNRDDVQHIQVDDPDLFARSVDLRSEFSFYAEDPDVLDTWFSSALWPLSTLGWPEPSQSAQTKDLLPAFNPTSVLSTAREIITLWVSRMVMMNRYLLGEGAGPVPFRDVFIHAVVQDGEGKRMSKSAGNGVDPLDIIESHGADALRFTLCQMATSTQDVRMPVVLDATTGKNTSPKFDLGRNLCNKLWNAARFTLSIFERAASNPDQSSSATPPLSLIDRWMLSRLATTVREADRALANYEFADYAESVYKLLWWDFCDWYLEAIKPTADKSASQRAVLAHALDVILRLLHPVAPFITESIFEQIRAIETAPIAGVRLDPPRTAGLLCTAGWPVLDESLIDAHAEAEFESLRDLINQIRNVRSEHQVPPKRKVTLHAPRGIIEHMARAPMLVETLAGLEGVSELSASGANAASGASVAFRAAGEELRLSNLADAIDTGAERDRLGKQLDQLRKSETALAGRLNNPGYAERAPAKLVEESKAQLVKIQGEIAAIEARLKDLPA